MTITHIKNGEYNLRNAIELKKIIAAVKTEYILIYLHAHPIEWGEYAVERLLRIAQATGAGMVYADRYKQIDGQLNPYPVNDYQKGSLRDDFDFGAALLYKTAVAKQAVAQIDDEYRFAALYALRLQASLISEFIHIDEFLYTESAASTTGMFEYVDPKNRDVQIEMEKACTLYLKETGAYLKPEFQSIHLSSMDFQTEASVIIPVRNREKTIEDAVRSALQQQTNFPFNVIVIDNHSTDSTTAILKKMASADKRLIHRIPERTDLGIGGCWNEAINHPQCGKFAVQLDSDDLYSHPSVLTKIVQAFYEQNCPMVIGSYQMVNFQLEEIPPGIIDHREWTPENGRNNALRINGLGAPRAFYTPLLREIKFPNTNYGEDYAVGLAISRHYQIGRIYEPLYLCRRWEDNSDAALDIVKLNTYNHYKDKLRTIEILERKGCTVHGERCTALPVPPSVHRAPFTVYPFSGFSVKVQYSPGRIRSANAPVEVQRIEAKTCFLCKENRLPDQEEIPFLSRYTILVNPYPIFPEHLTIPDNSHTPQLITGRVQDMLRLAKELPGFTVLYNGPHSGASMPDHFHFQAGNKGFMPIEQEVHSFPGKKQLKKEPEGTLCFMENYLRHCLVLESENEEWLLQQFDAIVQNMHSIQSHEEEPMMNVITWIEENRWQLVIFPRRQHRPHQFYETGDQQILVSPGVVDFGGVLIVVREEDWKSLNETLLTDIFSQLTYTDTDMQSLLNRLQQG